MPLPPNWNALQGQLNALENSIMGQLHGKMPGFNVAHGWYFQGIKTASTIPKQGELVPPDLTGKPHYQQESWADLALNFPPSIPCTLEVWNYEGPNGKDWCLRLLVDLDGVPWLRVVSGNQVEVQTEDWTAMNPSEIV
jgi:hypothetical protein